MSGLGARRLDNRHQHPPSSFAAIKEFFGSYTVVTFMDPQPFQVVSTNVVCLGLVLTFVTVPDSGRDVHYHYGRMLSIKTT